MFAPAKLIESFLEEESLEEKSKFIRFEHISERFTYIAIVFGLIISLLPYQLPFEKEGLYILASVVAIFSILWFRLMPKKYSGRTKNLIFYLLSILFASFAIYLTRGIHSQAVFLFYLIGLAAAASMDLKETVLVTSLSAVVILFHAFIKESHLPATQSLSLAILHIWGLVSTVSYGWLVFKEEKRAKEVHGEYRLEGAKELNRLKDEFVFVISTKLANPIVTLREYMTTALSTPEKLSSEQNDMIKKIEDNSRRLELLVEDLLDLSKIETGALQLNLEKVNVGRVVGFVLSDFALRASEKKISLNYERRKEEIFAKADPSRLHEIIANLVDNSIKYSPPITTVKIEVFKKGSFAQIDVENTGPAIPEEAQKHLFQKFYRSSEVKGKVEGSGLGLFICKELVRRQGGTIWYSSTLKFNNKFSFRLPIAQDE